MKFNNETLIEYCKTNNIILLKSHENVSRDSYIQGKCICCENSFNKNFRQLVKTGAYCSGCMTIISNNKIHISNVKYDVNMLNTFCDENSILLIDDYSNKFINRNSIIEGMCKGVDCENMFSKTFRELLKINGYCQDCSKENGKIKIKNTSLKKYGVDCCLKRKDIRDKIKQTTLAKYGVEHNSQLERIKQQKKEKSIEKFGTEYVLQSTEIRNQIKQTNLQKYGVENPQQNKEIKNKTCETNMIKFGCKSPTGSQFVKEKVIETNIKRYGVPHHSQNAEIAEKMLNNSYNLKKYKMPSGKIISYQGYENFALDELLFEENISEDDISTERNCVPEIWFYDKDNVHHRYYVDIYIKSQNRCVEVKSSWTNQPKNFVFEKKEAAENLGYKYDLWIYDKNRNKVEL